MSEAADPPWLAPRWDVPRGVRAVATTRLGPGVSAPPYDRFNLGLRSGDDPGAVAANRAALGRALRLPSPPRWLDQVHGARVVTFDGDNGATPEADAAVTRSAGVVLAILSADCLPILVASEDGAELAAIHAGWRGIAAGVIEAAIARLGAEPARLVAWLGPAISRASYEVGADVRDAMTAWRADAAAAFEPHGERWLCDLYALARMRLGALGVERVSGGGRCTARERDSFYSYRRDGRTGRMATLLWREGA